VGSKQGRQVGGQQTSLLGMSGDKFICACRVPILLWMGQDKTEDRLFDNPSQWACCDVLSISASLFAAPPPSGSSEYR